MKEARIFVGISEFRRAFPEATHFDCLLPRRVGEPKRGYPLDQEWRNCPLTELDVMEDTVITGWVGREPCLIILSETSWEDRLAAWRETLAADVPDLTDLFKFAAQIKILIPGAWPVVFLPTEVGAWRPSAQVEFWSRPYSNLVARAPGVTEAEAAEETRARFVELRSQIPDGRFKVALQTRDGMRTLAEIEVEWKRRVAPSDPLTDTRETLVAEPVAQPPGWYALGDGSQGYVAWGKTWATLTPQLDGDYLVTVPDMGTRVEAPPKLARDRAEAVLRVTPREKRVHAWKRLGPATWGRCCPTVLGDEAILVTVEWLPGYGARVSGLDAWRQESLTREGMSPSEALDAADAYLHALGWAGEFRCVPEQGYPQDSSVKPQPLVDEKETT